ncbi:MAG: RluA family pseudouridine synthase [Nesterenkonia sp.]|nr:RluA family pseudouridine synthase [Nesterenkonia sp.]
MSSELCRIVVAEAADGRRADAVLAQALGVSRTEAATRLEEGLVRREAAAGGGPSPGRTVKKSEKLGAGEVLLAERPTRTDPLEVKVEIVEGLHILHQDRDVVVVDKPVGVAAHPSPGWTGPTVVGGLLGAGVEIATSGAQERRGIVHRLDVGTSGVMVVAKTERAYSLLKDAFRDRTPTKTYRALVQGLPDPVDGTVDAPIGRHPGHDWRFAVVESGRDARTHYRLLEAYGRASLMDVRLETGRTHQIRVHFSALGHPCAGDLTYGADPHLAAELGLTRQWLHAAELSIDHPGTGDRVTFAADLPPDLSGALSILEDG